MLTRSCAECSGPFPESELLNFENAWICAPCKRVFFQRIKEGAKVEEPLVYASIGQRLAAVLLDFVICLLLAFMCLIPFIITASWVIGPGHRPLARNHWFPVLMRIIAYSVAPLYQIFFIARYDATPGKMLMMIKVVTPSGGRVSVGQSIGRYFAQLLSGILYIGYLIAIKDPEKRTLHDRMCATRVVLAG